MEKKKENPIVISVSSAEIFKPTMYLKRLIKMRKDGSNLPLSDILQQAWEGRNGTVEWRDIPTIIE